MSYDTLIVAAGAQPHYFGRDDWALHAPGLETREDATEIRRRIFSAFEAAERDPDPAARSAWMTFGIVGAGPTGVALAGAIAEIARHTLRREFRAIDPTAARVVLIDAAERVLSSYPPGSSARCAAPLARLGVEVRTTSRLESVSAHGLPVRTGQAVESIAARTVLWAAGVRASPLGGRLAEARGVDVDRTGRVPVGPQLTVPGHDDVFVIGDLARTAGRDGAPLPGIAPVAIQHGRYVGRAIRARLGEHSVPPFRYVDKGPFATIGRAAAIADFGRFGFSGLPAWLLWLFVHLLYLVDFENRVLGLVR